MKSLRLRASHLLAWFLVASSSNALSVRNKDAPATPATSGIGAISRRDILTQTALSTLVTTTALTGQPLPVLAAGNDEIAPASPKTILVTGANSGVGLEGCKRLASQGHNLILACRTLQKAQDTVEILEPHYVGGAGKGYMIPAECDLASLKSIDAFVEKLKGLMGTTAIDTVCLNAGLCRNVDAKDCARTADGFELTVGTNHFGHFYLNHQVLPMVKTDGGRIVVTASGVHDPESPGGKQGVTAYLGEMAGLDKLGRDCEMIDGSDFNADKAYKDSKLCNVLFTRELQRRLDAKTSTNGITANCFSPGLIVGTGLFRYQNPFTTKLFDVAATNLFKVGETPEWGGASLAYMTQVSTKGQYYNSPPGSSKYGDAAFGKQFTIDQVAKEAQDDAKARKLWELSCRELGLPA